MLPRLVGPAGGRVALEVVVPGLPRGVHEVQLFEGEGAVEPDLGGRVLEGDRLLRDLEGLGQVRGLVHLLGAGEVGRGEVAQEARVVGLLGGGRLEGLDGRGHVARDEIGDAERTQGLGRSVAFGLRADLRHGGDHGGGLGVELLRRLARPQHDEPAVGEPAGQARLDEAVRADRLDQLSDRRYRSSMRADQVNAPTSPAAIARPAASWTGGDGRAPSAIAACAADPMNPRRFSLGEAELHRVGEHLVAVGAAGDVLVHACGLGRLEAAFDVGGDEPGIRTGHDQPHSKRPRPARATSQSTSDSSSATSSRRMPSASSSARNCFRRASRRR